MRKITISVIILLAIGIAAYQYQKYRIAPKVNFEALALTDLNGQPVKLSDFKGKKVFLNFYATWCGPCRGEFPSLEKAAATLVPDNFVFLSISDKPLPLLNSFKNQVDLSHLIFLHTTQKLHALNIYTVPTNYLLNTSGKLVFEKIDVENWDNADILQELKQKAQN